MSRYSVIYPDDALRYLKSRQLEDDTVSVTDIVKTAGDGDEVDLGPVNTMADQLRKLKKRFPEKLSSRDPQGGRFESEACCLVHSHLAGFAREALVDPNFWTWLAVARLPDVLEWRFGSGGRPSNAKNYGIGNRGENFYFRLWLRADIGKATGSDPYVLARSGDQDLWRSHLLRQAYANARALAVSLLKLQSGQLKVNGKPAKKLASGDDPKGIRMLAKRLKRVRANVFFEYLTPQDAEFLILELSVDLNKGN